MEFADWKGKHDFGRGLNGVLADVDKIKCGRRWKLAEKSGVEWGEEVLGKISCGRVEH